MDPEREPPPDDFTDRVESMLFDCFERAATERDRALADLCRQHPDLAPELKSRYAHLLALGFLDEADTERALPERFGRYRILELLGSGGMGVVYLAEDEVLGRRVALKLIRAVHLHFPRARERFKREVLLASRLDHPCICTVHEAGEVDGTPFLAMRYLEGETLAKRIERLRGNAGAREDIQTWLWLFERLARGLHAAHEAGLVHRDVKPANVLVTRDGDPVLIDFGLALDESGAHALTQSGDRLGTPAYMAPEQIRGDGSVDRRADVYGLGATLYECLTLRCPFAAGSREDLYRRILTTEPEDPRRHDRRIGPGLRAVLAMALAKRADQRYPTALALAEDLERQRLRQPVSARPASGFRRARQLLRRHPARAAALAIVAAAGLAAPWWLARGEGATLAPRFATFLGGAGLEEVYAGDCHGDLFAIVGRTDSPDFAGGSRGADDAFVALFDLQRRGSAALLWSRRLGGSSDEIAFDVVLSGSGPSLLVTVAGYTRSADFPVTRNALQPTLRGDSDAFVVQLDGGGEVTWSTFAGGTGRDRSAAVLADPVTGVLTVAGYSDSSDWLPAAAGGFDTFVARIDPAAGAVGLRGGRMIGGSGEEGLHHLAPMNLDLIDIHVADGDVVTVAGTTRSADFPVVHAFQTTPGGSEDIFIARLDGSLSTLLWSTYLGRQSSEAPLGLVVDSAGIVDVGGVTNGPFWTTPGCCGPDYRGTRDAVIARLDPNKTGAGQLCYAAHFGDRSEDFITDLGVAPSGILTACGGTFRYGPSGWRGTADAWVRDYPGLGTGFVLEVDPAGGGDADLRWLSFIGAGALGSGGSETCRVLAWTAAGEMVLAGNTDNPAFPTRDAPQPTHAGGVLDAVVIVLDPPGSANRR